MKKKKSNRADQYDPLLKTDLSFDQLLKVAAHTPPEDKSKPKKKPHKK